MQIIQIFRKTLFNCFIPPQLPFSFWYALSMMTGIWLGYSQSLTPLVFFCFLLFASPRKTILSFFFVFGCTAYLQKTSPKLPAPLLENIEVKGTVLDKAFIGNDFWQHRTRIHVSDIKTSFGWAPYNFDIYLYSTKRFPAWVQDKIELDQITIKQAQEDNFYLYLCREGIAGTSFVKNPFCKKRERPQKSLLNWFFWQRELLQIKLRKKMSPFTFAFFSSLFFGNRQSVKKQLDQYKNTFKYWGILHHLARSGLHLIIFIMIWDFLLSLYPLHFAIKHTITFITTICYLILSWSSLSFIRALFLYLLYKYATLRNTHIHTIHSISIACLSLLIFNPLHLFFLDFQLSFLLSFCLLWIAHVHHLREIYTHKSIAE